MITEEDLALLEKRYDKFYRQVKKRKAAVMDIVETIASSMDLNNKEFMNFASLETEEELGIKMPNMENK